MADKKLLDDEVGKENQITCFNYNRPKWFGGFFGASKYHNKAGNCKYNIENI
jgi:hypothetical protein